MRMPSKRPSRHSTEISYHRRLNGRILPGDQAVATETGPNWADRRIALQKENQAKINSQIRQLHRKVEAIVGRINEISNKLGAVRSRTVSLRTVTKIRSINRDE